MTFALHFQLLAFSFKLFPKESSWLIKISTPTAS